MQFRMVTILLFGLASLGIAAPLANAEARPDAGMYTSPNNSIANDSLEAVPRVHDVADVNLEAIGAGY